MSLTGDFPLSFGCMHVMVDEGEPHIAWTSNNTASEPPKSAQAMQKRRCQKCGGTGWYPVMIQEENN